MVWQPSNEYAEPELEHLESVSNAFNTFASSLLCNETSMRNFNFKPKNDSIAASVDESVLHEDNLDDYLQRVKVFRDTWSFYFINKYLVRDRNVSAPLDANKLRISPASFKRVIEFYNLPASFVHTLCRHFLPSGRGYHELTPNTGSGGYGHWYLLPVRVQVRCTDKRKGHVTSASNNNQMDPLNYLHLPDAEVDIRGSCIAVYTGHDLSTGNSTFVIFNLLDGRWAKVVEEPELRLAEAFHRAKKFERTLSPYLPHLVYFTSISRWWTNAISSVNDQLIAYEKALQHEMDSEHDSTDFYAKLNRALHAIAAHLHRYHTDLNSLEATITQVIHQLTQMRHTHEAYDHANRKTVHGLEQTASQLRATNDFSQEVKEKSRNILALLFNRMQIANTRAMNVVLLAIQTDTQTSQRLSEEMRKDSLSMKTIAIVTMFFLPGATFAALFSMPFMDDNAWISNISRIWLWFAFTIPTTSFVFLFYWHYKRQGKKQAIERSRKDIELNET